MKLNVLLVFLVGALVGIMSACEPEENEVSEAFLQACPKGYMVSLDVPNSAHKNLGEVAEHYRQTLQFTRDVNLSVQLWLAWIETIVSYPTATFTDTESIWGPWLPEDGLSSAEYRFVMKMNSDDSFDFSFEARSRGGTDEDFIPVYTGHVNPGGTPTLNSGTMVFDFDASSSVDLAVSETGKLNVTYDYTNGKKDVYVEFDEFVGDRSDEALTANYHYHADNNGEGYFDFETKADVHVGTPEADLYPNPEHWELRTRWTKDGDGRTDIVLVGEDLDTAGVTDFRISECWDTQFLSTYLAHIIAISSESIEDIKWGEEGSCTSFPAWDAPQL